ISGWLKTSPLPGDPKVVPVAPPVPVVTPSVLADASVAQVPRYAGGALSGVAMEIPPALVLPSITAAVAKAVAAIPPGKT
ncbi:hypothetical protein LAJ55_15670, partial [Streptococcus pneumoniae]|uniref:hypothetical protein n=1 Tax=Streptococcus pneumoniae TaxID=1313 RepID=UPI001CBA92F0